MWLQALATLRCVGRPCSVGSTVLRPSFQLYSNPVVHRCQGLQGQSAKAFCVPGTKRPPPTPPQASLFPLTLAQNLTADGRETDFPSNIILLHAISIAMQSV